MRCDAMRCDYRVTAILFQTNMPESLQSNESSINQLERDVHVVNVGRAFGNRRFIFLSSPLLACRARLALRAKCHVRLTLLMHARWRMTDGENNK